MGNMNPPSMTEAILAELAGERACDPGEPVKIHLTLELTVPAGVSALAYKDAVKSALEAFQAKDIAPRVWKVAMGPTRELPLVTYETRPA
jgi:hypothetical protein